MTKRRKHGRGRREKRKKGQGKSRWHRALEAANLEPIALADDERDVQLAEAYERDGVIVLFDDDDAPISEERQAAMARKAAIVALGGKLKEDEEEEDTMDAQEWYGTGTFWHRKLCTHDPVLCIEGENKTWSVWASDKYGAFGKRDAFDIVLNCTGDASNGHGNILPSFLMKHVNKGKDKYEEMVIDWPDMGIPPVKAQFWTEFASMLYSRQAKVLIHCMGGHGRTGTAIACLLIVTCGYTAKQAIKWVRESYCTEAIESEAQLKYIRYVARTLQGEKEGNEEPPAGSTASSDVGSKQRVSVKDTSGTGRYWGWNNDGGSSRHSNTTVQDALGNDKFEFTLDQLNRFADNSVIRLGANLTIAEGVSERAKEKNCLLFFNGQSGTYVWPSPNNTWVLSGDVEKFAKGSVIVLDSLRKTTAIALAKAKETGVIIIGKDMAVDDKQVIMPSDNAAKDGEKNIVYTSDGVPSECRIHGRATAFRKISDALGWMCDECEKASEKLIKQVSIEDSESGKCKVHDLPLSRVVKYNDVGAILGERLTCFPCEHAERTRQSGVKYCAKHPSIMLQKDTAMDVEVDSCSVCKQEAFARISEIVMPPDETPERAGEYGG